MEFKLGLFAEPMMQDERYIAAHRCGGMDKVNRLVDVEFSNRDARMAELERMENTGLWRIRWHFSSRDMSRRDFGVVASYLGD